MTQQKQKTTNQQLKKAQRFVEVNNGQVVSLGADPEFLVFDKANLRIEAATNFFHSHNSQVGVDGAGTPGEFRPRYKWNAID